MPPTIPKGLICIAKPCTVIWFTTSWPTPTPNPILYMLSVMRNVVQTSSGPGWSHGQLYMKLFPGGPILHFPEVSGLTWKMTKGKQKVLMY